MSEYEPRYAVTVTVADMEGNTLAVGVRVMPYDGARFRVTTDTNGEMRHLAGKLAQQVMHDAIIKTEIQRGETRTMNGT